MKTIIFLFAFIVLTSCMVKNKTTNKEQGFRLPLEYQGFLMTQKNELLILTHENDVTPKYPERILDLVIIDSQKNEEIFKNQLKNGTLEWIGENTLKVDYTPGNPEKGKTYFYSINLKTKTITNHTNTQP